MSEAPDSEAQKAMGARLRAVREALDLTQQDMLQNMGVVVTTLSGWETGRNQIDIVKLARLATRWGFTTDWVARGDLSGLRKDVADKLETIIAAAPRPRRGRRRTPDSPITSSLKPRENPPPPRPIKGGNAARNPDKEDCRTNVAKRRLRSVAEVEGR